jgi:hypothetical protein
MFTLEEAQTLVRLPKKVIINDELQDHMQFDQTFPFKQRLFLISPDEPDFLFLYDTNQSSKNHFKLSLYLMDDETKIGLIRIDFNGQHVNPQTLTDQVPDIFHPYVGTFFDYNCHHIHYYVEGYKTTLDWAIPLAEVEFPIKQINDNNDVLVAFLNFNVLINLVTVFNINPLLI